MTEAMVMLNSEVLGPMHFENLPRRGDFVYLEQADGSANEIVEVLYVLLGSNSATLIVWPVHDIPALPNMRPAYIEPEEALKRLGL